MAIRPIDLQQVLAATPDASRNTAAQQQAASAQQVHVDHDSKRHAEEAAETVQRFEEAGSAVIRDQRGQSGQQGADADEDDQEQESAEDEQAGAAQITSAPTVRLGRHVDMQA